MKKLFIAICFLAAVCQTGGASPLCGVDSLGISDAVPERVDSGNDMDVPLAPLVEASSPWLFAVKTNMLFDVALVPNIGIEAAFGKGWSVTADWHYAWWTNDSSHRFWCVYGGDFEVRKWLTPSSREGYSSRLRGHHFGFYGQMFVYDFAFGSTGQKSDNGWNYGFGISYGYSLPLTPRLNIDFTIGVGYVGGTYEKYHYDDNCYVWDSTNKRKYFGPSRAEVSLVYLIGNRYGKGGRK